MYRNLKISKKLLVGFGAVVLTALIIVGIAIRVLMDVGSMEHQMFVGPYVSTNNAMGIRRDINVLGKDLRSAALEKNIEKYEDDLAVTVQSVADRMAKLDECYQGDKSMLTTLQAKIDALGVQRQNVIQLMKTNQWDDATQTILGPYYSAFQECANQANLVYDDADKRGADFDQQATNSVTNTFYLLIGLFVLLLLLSIFIATVTTRAIVRPLIEIEVVAKNISKGKIENEISYQSKDEIGVLADSFRETSDVIHHVIGDVSYLMKEISEGNFAINTKAEGAYVGDFRPMLVSLRAMVHSMSDTLRQINQAADQVSSGSDQVSSGAQALSQGATEQASSVQELAATINEISFQIRSNAENSRQASADANNVGQEMLESNQHMQGMIQAMADISESSSQIGKIIKTIEDIAFQTNILALNAAVEAARAGAAGKGFAVVADEVRNLASKSAEASKNTSALIESSIKAVENGSKIADETAHSLLTAVEGANQVTITIDKISAASNEQASAASQITQGIDQISSVVQTNSATAEQSAAASEELSGQAQMLKSLIGRFRLQDSGSVGKSLELEPMSKPSLPESRQTSLTGSSKY